MITVIGYDGTPLAAAARAAIDTADLVIGGRRHLDALGAPEGARVFAMGDVSEAVDAALACDGDVAVLASGDPGFFGIVRRLRAAGGQPVVHPAVSSVSRAFARIGLPWDDAVVVSAHGRDPRPALAVALSARTVAVLTDPSFGPAHLGRALVGSPRRLVVCERLGESDERVSEVSPEQAAARSDWRDPNLVLVLSDVAVGEPGWLAGGHLSDGSGWALPDDAFDHRDGMITKAEIRAYVLARLGPQPGLHLWDVGAGSGSVAVECARLGAAVVAVERDADQCARITSNAKALDVAVRVVHGAAPAAFAGLIAPDAVLVGGGGPGVLAACAALGPRRVVVALAALERIGPTWEALTGAGYRVEGSQLAASRLVALPDATHRLAGANPVTIVTGERR